MRKLMLFVGGGIAGFALAVLVMRFVLGTGGDATIELAVSAPPVPAVSDSATLEAVEEIPPSQTSVADPAAATTGEAAPVAESGPSSGQVAASTTGDFHFKADATRSSAKILVTQTGVLGDALLVATGSNVTGDVFLTADGVLGDSPSSFRLDLRTMRSSDSELSSFLKNQLGAATYPYADFTIASTSGIPATYTDGTEFKFTMTGPLTMHGRTKSITWTARARQAGEYLTFAADADFLLTDYGWTPPNYGVAWAKNSVHIQVMVIARKVSSPAGEQVRAAGPQPTGVVPHDEPTPAPSIPAATPPMLSGAPVPAAPAAGSGLPSMQASASSLTTLLGGLAPVLTGARVDVLPALSLESLLNLLGGLGGDAPFWQSR